ncbi:MAG: hypothetical protein J2P18_20735, partial [Nocardia sp.]|nr:hypothetical protein [Nocardia sp.]
MSELRVDPAELAALGQQLLALADRAAQLHEKAQSIVHTAGPCWGDDEPGRQFADTYLPDAGAISGKASQFVQALRVYGNNVTATARNLSDQDRIGGAAVNPQTPKQVSVALPAGSTPSASARYPGNGADSASPGTVSAPGSNAPAAPASATSVAQPNRAGAPNQATAPNRTASPEQAGDSDPAPRQSASAPRSPDETMPGSSSAKDPAATRPQSTSSPRTSAEPSRTSPSLTAESARPADAGAPTGPDGAQRTGQLAKASGSQPDSDSDHANPRPAPPRQRKQDEAKQQPKAPGKASQEQAERPKSRAAEELAKHYGVRLAGLDLPGADESALAELDAALESFLRRYPFAAPRTVAIRALPEGEWSQVSWIRDQAGAPVTDEVAVTT